MVFFRSYVAWTIVWLALVLPSAPTFAGEYRALVSAVTGETVRLDVQFAGDGETVETEVTLSFATAFISMSEPVAQPGAICHIVSPTRFRAIPVSGGNLPLSPTFTTYCSVNVTVAENAPIGLIPFTPLDLECYNAQAQRRGCSLRSPSGVRVTGPPGPRTLRYTPSLGSTISFAQGVIAGTQAPPKTIEVGVNGSSGVASLSACSVSGPGAEHFSLTPTALTFENSESQELVLGCTYPADTGTAVLTCIEFDGDTPFPGTPRTFPLNCPVPSPPASINPTVSTSPISGATINTYAPTVGSLGIGYIGLIANGGSGVGSTLVSCSASGAVEIAAFPLRPSGPGPIQFVMTASDDFQALTVGSVLTSGTSPVEAAGTVTCQIANQTDVAFIVNSPRLIPPDISPPPPPGGGLPGGVTPPQSIDALTPAWLAALALLLAVGSVLVLIRRR